jgi:hypothetical protein
MSLKQNDHYHETRREAAQKPSDGEIVEILKLGIWEALDTLRNDLYVSRAVNAAHILEALLDEHGYPEPREG